MSAKFIAKLLEATTPLKATTSKLDNMLKAASKEDQARIKDIIKNNYTTKVEGGTTILTPNTVGEIEAGVTVVQREAVAAKMGVQMGNVPDPESKVGADLNTSSYVSSVILPEHMRVEFPKLNNTNKVLSQDLRMDHWTTSQNDISFKDKKWGTIKAGIFGNVLRSSGDFADDLVRRPTLDTYAKNRMNQAYKDIMNDIYKGLSKENIELFHKINHLHDDNVIHESVSHVNEGFEINGKFHQVPRRVQDAILARRALLDHGYWAENSAAVRRARHEGVMVDEGGSLLKPVDKKRFEEKAMVGGQKLTPEMKEAGYTVWREHKKGPEIYRVLSPSDVHSLKNLPDDFKLLEYRPGYSPVKYTQKWAITKINLKDGKLNVARHATGRSRHVVEQAVDRLAGREPDTVYFAHRSHEDGMSLVADNSLPTLINNLSTMETENLEKALKGLEYADVDIEKLLRFSKFFDHKRASHMMRRGRRLQDAETVGIEGVKSKDAPIMPDDQALAHHMQKSASYTAHAENFQKLERAFMDEFGGFVGSGNAWDTPFFPKGRINGRSGREAYAVQSQIKRVEDQLSSFDKVLDDYAVDLADTLMTSKVGKSVDEMLTKMTKEMNFDIVPPSVLVNLSKAAGATAKLGIWAMSQLPMQMTAILNVVGYSGRFAARAAGDIMSVYLVPTKLGIPRTKGAEELHKLIQDSGFVAGLDFATMADIATSSTKLGNSRLKKILIDKGLLPYQLGEGSVRAAAWFAEHRRMLSEIKKGEAAFKLEDVGSRAYLDEISNRASVPALNMTKVNQHFISRGLLGMPMQFKSFAIQQANFMFGKMPLNRRLGVFGAWTAAFGIEGISYFMDLLIASEHAVVNAPNIVGGSDNIMGYGWWQRELEDIAGKAGEKIDHTGAVKWLNAKAGMNIKDGKQFVKDWVKGGALPALTGGEFSFTHRAGLGRFFTEFFHNAPIDDLAFGPGYQTFKLIFQNNIQTAGQLAEVIKGDRAFSTNWALQRISKGVESLSGPSAFAEATEMATRGELRDKKGRYIDDEATLQEILFLGAGLGIQEQNKRWERLFSAKERDKLVNKWEYQQAIKIGEAYVDDPTYAEQLAEEKMKQLAAYNRARLGGFMAKVEGQVTSRKAPADQREIESAFRLYLKAFSEPEAKGVLETIRKEIEAKRGK